MASVAKVITRNSVASTGAPKAMPPIRSSEPLPPARTVSAATTKNSGMITSPWVTICITAPWAPLGSRAKIPSTMKPICAMEE